MTDLARRRWRRRLLWAGVPLLLLALALVLKVGAMIVLDERGRSAFSDDEFGTAHDSFSANRSLNWFEPWVASFDAGTAAFRLAEFEAAESLLERALAVAPAEEQCRVRINLALSLEAQGDAALAQGAHSEARGAWRDGETAVTGPGCSESDLAGAANVVASRLQDKLKDSALMSDDPGDLDGLDPDEQRAQELEQRNQEAQEQRQANDRANEDEDDPPSNDSPSDPPVYQW
jgi:tetratricopeptide (TPR) repeat protein